MWQERAWNYAGGHGQDPEMVEEFFSVLSMVGYKGVVSLEMEEISQCLLKAGLISSNFNRCTGGATISK